MKVASLLHPTRIAFASGRHHTRIIARQFRKLSLPSRVYTYLLSKSRALTSACFMFNNNHDVLETVLSHGLISESKCSQTRQIRYLVSTLAGIKKILQMCIILLVKWSHHPTWSPVYISTVTCLPPFRFKRR